MDILWKLLVSFICLLLVTASPLVAQSGLLPVKDQIRAAVSPAPDELKEGAKVLGYIEGGKLDTLREGTNHLICVADDPGQSNFHVACYHKDLEPFMERGRQLKAKDFSRKKVDSLRREEIKKGKLVMPQKPMALYSLTGSKDSFNYSTGQITDASPLYVIYIPYATEASTGLSKKPVTKGAPWIMEPGTPWAHIMVMTGRKVGSTTLEKN